jgi:AcrR family transcriptional regulator
VQGGAGPGRRGTGEVDRGTDRATPPVIAAIDAADPDPERERLIAAFGRVAAEYGYREVSAERIALYADLPRSRYEAHFQSTECALLTAQDAFLGRLRSEALGACEACEDWPGQVRAALSAVLGRLVEAHGLARALWVEGAAASLAAAERRFAALEALASLLREGRMRRPQAALLPPSAERVLIGGVASIVSAHLLAEDPAALSALEPELLEVLLVLCLGPEEAARTASV